MSAVIGTNAVNAVLKAWANNHVENVPAQHTSTDYLIRYDDLVEHLNNLSQDELSEILLDVEDELIA